MLDNTFKKTYRLLSAKDFSYIREGAKIRQNRWIRVYFKPASKERMDLNQNSRIGIAVSKKVGNACVRSSLKRVIRETFRNSEYRHNAIDFVVTVSPNLLKKHNKSQAINILRSSFLSILPRLTMVKD